MLCSLKKNESQKDSWLPFPSPVLVLILSFYHKGVSSAPGAEVPAEAWRGWTEAGTHCASPEIFKNSFAFRCFVYWISPFRKGVLRV
jgi:hypothetical protein